MFKVASKCVVTHVLCTWGEKDIIMEKRYTCFSTVNLTESIMSAK